MSTTSLKLPEDVKQLAAAAASQQGISPHAFMVDAIRAASVAAEKRAALVSDAIASRAEARESGKGYDAAEVHAYIQERARGGKAPAPKARSWRD
jgi:predicted transcriptional regulator